MPGGEEHWQAKFNEQSRVSEERERLIDELAEAAEVRPSVLHAAMVMDERVTDLVAELGTPKYEAIQLAQREIGNYAIVLTVVGAVMSEAGIDSRETLLSREEVRSLTQAIRTGLRTLGKTD